MRNMEIEKPKNFTRHKDKFVNFQKVYESHKRRRVCDKLEYNITLFAKREELKDKSEINENFT